MDHLKLNTCIQAGSPRAGAGLLCRRLSHEISHQLQFKFDLIWLAHLIFSTNTAIAPTRSYVSSRSFLIWTYSSKSTELQWLTIACSFSLKLRASPLKDDLYSMMSLQKRSLKPYSITNLVSGNQLWKPNGLADLIRIQGFESPSMLDPTIATPNDALADSGVYLFTAANTL